MKALQCFDFEDKIPSNAKFISTEQQDNKTKYIYEVPESTIKTKKENNDNKESIDRILKYLNLKTKRNFTSENKLSIKHINARLNEGVDPEKFKIVIDNMTKEWGGNPKMEKHLVPQTLFGNKFHNYLEWKGEGSDREEAFKELDKLNKKVLDENQGNLQV